MAKNIGQLVAEISAVQTCKSALDRIQSLLENERYNRTLEERSKLWETLRIKSTEREDENSIATIPVRRPRKAKVNPTAIEAEKASESMGQA